MFQRITHSPDQTQSIAERLAALLEPGDILTLSGDLGAGKTTFTQGLAKGLAVEDPVNSPTFTLIREYEGRIPLYHMDVYRLGDKAGAENLGIDEYLYGDGVCVIEWAEYIASLLPEEYLDIAIRKTGESERQIQISGKGKRYAGLIKELDQTCPI
ncbi:tRNA (adenosine(37)-N6)-threonylcarbamoyltransferase complex ATPase subunit type 1 TsaE [Effusibacillus lacus]|uniref:tRNA threonylcarbamoyladenosine biosynthesis protein TsaE n=1 Tax=Effusibacillus lacus TaxID=1348429 RepID=A0A292YFI0_9BACL|nr:tRNA (adenosine(37)-N6)-threonylcarbamoyltransferase complex ATPase subunit type 1 TsaE [Effusibacillus lacus]TCS74340.1 tRNA threonylcarbamoyladenosine biosynthesis protein TsaE [Effusibacillus lacus]GAX88797.1 tRNA threonylcarbamoyladenosine biosynthesis protein TsaE [Effusibacillus lacus]